MIIAPHIPHIAPHTDLDKFVVAKDYIQCLAKVERELTSSTIDLSDTSIPLAIRVSANSPHRRKERTSLNVYDSKREMEYLDHASAIIPATNGAFWAVFPAQAIDNTVNSTAYTDSVWYFPTGARGWPDGINLGTSDAGCHRTCPDGFTQFTAPTAPTPKVGVIRRNHPCGATYTNLRVSVSDYHQAFSELELDEANFNQHMARFGVTVTEKDDAMVDVLACCGGYYWDYSQDFHGIYFVPSNTLRLFVASKGIVQTLDSAGSKIVEVADATSPLLTETIVIPTYQSGLGILTLPQSPFPIGSTVAKTNYRGEIVVAGGVYLENAYDGHGESKNWAKRGEDRTLHEYPASRLQVKVGIQSVTRNTSGGKPGLKYYRLFAYVTERGSDPRRVTFGDGKKVMPLNPITTEGATLDDKGNGYFSQNRAPVMYPTVYALENGLLMYGGEFYATDKPRDFPVDKKFPPNERICGLNHLLNFLEAADLAKENPKKIVYNVPLLSCHVAKFEIQGERPQLSWLPMNISGAHGIAEGAVAIPYQNSIILVGGAQTEYTLTVGGISHPYDTGDLAKYTKPWDVIKQITNPAFTASKIKNITFFGKRVEPSSTDTIPFNLTIDCLRYDCLYSHAVQLGDSDFFVLPTSVLKYDPIPGTHNTNATLIRRRKPASWDNETSKELKEVHRLWYCYANMYVSEVVGLPVNPEGPEMFHEETPYWYGHSNPVKGSLGCITVREGEEYWLYYLGNGDKPARYFQIKILTTAKALHARGGGTGQTVLDAEAGDISYTSKLPGPRTWEQGQRPPNGGASK